MPRRGPGLSRVASELRRDARLALQAGAVVLQQAVVDKYSTPGTGRVYEKYNPRRTHQASSPGDPPAPDTGALRNSVQITQTERGYRVGTNLEYAPPLEYGTPRIAPRPAWRPAIDESRERMGAAIVATLNRPGA
jgi:phage gpG-like protein